VPAPAFPAWIPQWLVVPAPPVLRPAVRGVWFTSGGVPGVEQCVLPNGVVELIFALGDESHRVAGAAPVRRCWVAGLQRGPLVIAPAPGTPLVGIRFRAGGLRSLWRLPSHRLTDAVVEVDGFDDRVLLAVRERLADCGGVAQALDVLVDLLGPRLEPAVAGPVAGAVRALHAAPETAIATLARDLGVTHQHLVRVFRDQVGVAPRTLARILRFARAVRLAERSPAVRWSRVAAEAGYYDQAHLVADFRAFAGTTPTRLRALRIPGGEHLLVD
jgi:AraC-like DNA-binding protein